MLSRFNLNTALGRLRLLSWVEGISYILLLCVTMPLKYGLGMKEPNIVMGQAHGLLFVLYMLALLQATIEHRWSIKVFALVFLASIVPLGTFWAEKRLFVNN